LGASIGWENRKEINEKFNFIHGPEVGLNISLITPFNEVIAQFAPSFGYILGAQYKLNNDFYINLEVIPSVSTTFIIGNDSPVIQLNGNMRAATLGIVYTFKKKEKNKK
jgi:hypothetical protein